MRRGPCLPIYSYRGRSVAYWLQRCKTTLPSSDKIVAGRTPFRNVGSRRKAKSPGFGACGEPVVSSLLSCCRHPPHRHGRKTRFWTTGCFIHSEAGVRCVGRFEITKIPGRILRPHVRSRGKISRRHPDRERGPPTYVGQQAPAKWRQSAGALLVCFKRDEASAKKRLFLARLPSPQKR